MKRTKSSGLGACIGVAVLMGCSWGAPAWSKTMAPSRNPGDPVLRLHRDAGLQIQELRVGPDSLADVSITLNPRLHSLGRRAAPCEGYFGPSVAQLFSGLERPDFVLNGNLFSTDGSGFRPTLFLWTESAGVVQPFRMRRPGQPRAPSYLLWLGSGSRFRIAKIQVTSCPQSRTGICVNKIEDGMRGRFGFGWNENGPIQTDEEFVADLKAGITSGSLLELTMPVFDLDEPARRVQAYLRTVAASPVPRTLICLRPDATVSYLVAGAAGVPAIGQWILDHPESIHCEQVFNLDGGGSSQLWARQERGWQVYTRGRSQHVDDGRSPTSRGCPGIRPVQHYIAVKIP